MPPVVAAIVGGIAALGTVAAAATAAGVFLGISTLGWAAISVGVSIGSSLLAPKPKIPPVSPASVDRLRANIDPRTPRKTVVGITATATDIRDEEFNADQTLLRRWIVCASHEIDSFTEIWFDDELAWDSVNGNAAKFGTYMSVITTPLGNAAQNTGPRMGSSRKYTGLANVYFNFQLDGERGSPFVKGVPNRITIKAKGAKFYDPRLDSTVTGGSGSHRADDQSTWQWDDTYCRNPALAILFYLLGWQINSVLVVGKGIPKERIDLESFITAANICEETVNLAAGGTEQRYRCDGIWSEADSPEAVLGMLKSTCNADLDDVDGQIRITIFEDETGASIADFDDEDLVGGFEWQPYPPLNESFNIVRGTYTDPSDEALFQPRDYPEVSETSPDGIDRILTVNYPMVQSDTQARRLADLRLQRMQNPGTFKCTLQATGWRCQKNSIVRLTFAKRGWTNKVFRVAEYEANVNGTVPVVLREEYASMYVEPASDPAFDAVASTPYDPFKDPIIAAVNSNRQAIRNALIKNPRNTSDVARNLLTATDAGASTTISVARHDWDYPNSAADVTRELGTITGLAYNTVYYIYFDDADLTDTAPTYAATQTQLTGQNTEANPTRHPIGMIQTPAAGDPDTSETETPVTGGYETNKPHGWQLPLIRSAVIVDPRNTSDVSRNLITATDAGATATISVARHDWDYPDGTPDVTREEGTITGLSFGTEYYVYFDDETLVDGSPTYLASTSMVTGSNRYSTPGRHPIGLIRTPNDGDPDTSEAELPVNGSYANDPAFAWQIPLIRAGLIKNPRTTGDVARALMTATDAGATATISVARHDWDYNNGDPDVTRELDTITGLSFDTLYYVYFDDATLADGSPTYVATTTAADSINSYDQPGRHPIGAIFTPADGAADTSILDGDEVVVNYNASNDNNGAAIVAPTMPSTPITHEANANGSVNITFEWLWTGNEEDIDGFIVYLYAATPSESAYSKNLAYDTFGAESLCITDDGRRMYLGSTEGKIYQYDLYRRHDVSSAVFVGSKDLSATVTGEISGVTFHPDGELLWLSDTSGTGVSGTFREFPLSTAWDITTVGSENDNYVPGSPYEDISDLQISDDGGEMIFVCNTASDCYVARFAMSTAYDLTTAGTLSNRAFSAMTANYQFDTVQGLAINPGGTVHQVCGKIGSTRRLATLTGVSWSNITGANGNQLYDPAAALHQGDFVGITITEDGLQCTVVDADNMARTYRLSSANQISTATAPPNTNGGVGNPYTWGDNDARERAFTVPADRRELTVQGVATDGAYTFGVKAYRRVNTEVDATGIITNPSPGYPAASGTLVEPSSTYDIFEPYQPNSADEFVGRVTGQIASPSRSDVFLASAPTTLTPNVETHDIFVANEIAATLTIAAPTGVPTGAQTIKIRIVDDGTSRSLTWNSAYRAIGVTLPTATTANKTIYATAVWNALAAKWDVVDIKEEA